MWRIRWHHAEYVSGFENKFDIPPMPTAFKIPLFLHFGVPWKMDVWMTIIENGFHENLCGTSDVLNELSHSLTLGSISKFS